MYLITNTSCKNNMEYIIYEDNYTKIVVNSQKKLSPEDIICLIDDCDKDIIHMNNIAKPEKKQIIRK